MSCHPRPRSLRCISCETTPPMHCRDGDPARGARRNVEPVYSAMPDFTCANPGVSRFGRALHEARIGSVAEPHLWVAEPHLRVAEPVEASGERGEASPCLAPLGEGVQCEGAHRTRGAQREGTPLSSFEGAAELPPRRQGDVEVRRAHASHDDPQDRSPVSNADVPRVVGMSNPFDIPAARSPGGRCHSTG